MLDPSELEFDSVVSADQGAFDDTTSVWDVGTMNSGDSVALVLRVRLVGLGSVTNIAQTSASDQWDPDSVPGNNVPGEDDQDAVTIDIVPTSLGDRVWLDLDGDGIDDPGEPGIPGVELDIGWTNPDGSPGSHTAVTGADGSYGVPPSANLPSNVDVTVVVNPATSPNLVGLNASGDRDAVADGSATDQITSADSALPTGALADLDFDFGYTPDNERSLGNRVWWDRNGSGDATDGFGEWGIPDVTMTATWAGFDGTLGTADDVDFTTLTDSTGTYLFTGVPPGEYRVAVTAGDLPDGLDVATYDLDGLASANRVDLVLGPTEDQLDVDFSYNAVGVIGDTVWFDRDRDGNQDPGEPGLGGVQVTVTWAVRTASWTTVTMSTSSPRRRATGPTWCRACPRATTGSRSTPAPFPATWDRPPTPTGSSRPIRR